MLRSPFVLIVLLVLAVAVVGVLAIGAFPPSVEPRPVERVLPNDRFQTR
ncbi:hypothetical protein [Plastoroseomonas arctica]|nr:hypothetical protein [Plastoroseomonas arctica]